MNVSYPHKRKSGPWRRIFAALFAFSAASAFAGESGEIDTDPTGILRKEHAIISKIVGVANETAKQIRQSGSVDQERVEKLHDFFTNFADKCHHAKEEEELFQTLKDMDFATTIVELLVKQHEEGRILLGGIEETLAHPAGALTSDEREALAEYLAQYALLMERHIQLENQYLWPKASRQLDGPEKKRLLEAFQRIERDELGEGFHEKYYSMAMALLAP